MYHHHKNVGLGEEDDPKGTVDVVNMNQISYIYNVQKCKRKMV
jgi:hypothetical protein